MKRFWDVSVLPHLLILVIGALIIYAIFSSGDNVTQIGIVFCIGVGLVIFAHSIASWWTKRISEQRNNLAEHFKFSKDLAKMVLYDWGGQVGNTWAFRIYGLIIAIASAYHLYNSMK